MLLGDRFYPFVCLIDGIHKNIQKLRLDFAPDFGVKSVHIFWIYELHIHPEGLTAAELAAQSNISRSLVSREIEGLRDDGYIEMQEKSRGKRKNYNSRITLTEKGRELARRIFAEGMRVQNAVNAGITEEELTSFYATLQKLHDNLRDAAQSEEP